MCVWTHTHAHTQDLHGITRFLHLEPLDNRALFVRTLERPIKARDPLGLKRLQVGRTGRAGGWLGGIGSCVRLRCGVHDFSRVVHVLTVPL